jgi:transposase
MGIYSKDLRVRAVEALERGIPRRDVVETFCVSLTTLKRWLSKRREGEDLSPGTSTGRKRHILADAEEEEEEEEERTLWEQLQENDAATLERHCEMWEEKRGVRVSRSTMSRAIRHKLGWSYKKDAGGHRARRREEKGFPGAAEGGRSEASPVRRRVLDQHRHGPALREGPQGREGARQGA